MNGLASGTTVRPGTELRIPQTGNPFPPPRALLPHPTTYTVLAGESIYQIACKFGDVDPMMIALANGLEAPYTLTAGTVLNIP
jgi:LysM repeat protein